MTERRPRYRGPPPARVSHLHRTGTVKGGPPRGIAPILALVVLLLVGVLAAPDLLRSLPNPLGSDETTTGAPDRRSTTTGPTTASEPTTTEGAGTPSSSAPPATTAAPVVRLRVVPAVRDVEVIVDGRAWTSDADGLIEAIAVGPVADVTVVGYTVSPSFQEVTFTGWGDGSTDEARTVETGADEPIELGVEVRYRVTVLRAGAAPGERVVLRAGDDEVPVTVGAPTWVPAVRATRGRGDKLVARPLTYRAEPSGASIGALAGAPVVPTPEAVITLG